MTLLDTGCVIIYKDFISDLFLPNTPTKEEPILLDSISSYTFNNLIPVFGGPNKHLFKDYIRTQDYYEDWFKKRDPIFFSRTRRIGIFRETKKEEKLVALDREQILGREVERHGTLRDDGYFVSWYLDESINPRTMNEPILITEREKPIQLLLPPGQELENLKPIKVDVCNLSEIAGINYRDFDCVSKESIKKII
jgi:hypothetical protein